MEKFMKYLKSTVFGVLILFATLSSMPQSKESNDSEGSAELRISTAKSEYLLGEPVRLERRLMKIGDHDRVRFQESDRSGTLRVFIAKGGGEFKRCTFDELLPYEEYSEGPGLNKAFHTVLFNSKPKTELLSEYGRREAEEGMILTDYAFPEPGDYRIKAIRRFSVRQGTDRYASSVDAESNEISIRVKQPEGDDLRVWEIMNSDPRIGYFMMEGEAPYRVLDTVLAKVDRITSEYPDSYLAGLLKVKAQEHRARRERIRQENEQERLKREKAISSPKKN
jgi:hypothetical protein